jgi:hypothetical protein
MPTGPAATTAASRNTYLTAALPQKEKTMLWTIAVILLVLWLFGMVGSAAIGSFIHILLILAVIMILINIIQGRRIVW